MYVYIYIYIYIYILLLEWADVLLQVKGEYIKNTAHERNIQPYSTFTSVVMYLLPTFIMHYKIHYYVLG